MTSAGLRRPGYTLRVKPLLLPLVLAFASGCLMGDVDNGEYTYQFQCMGCHGANGEGGIETVTYDAMGNPLPGVLTADLTERVPLLTDERILEVLHDGQGAMPGQFGDDDETALDVLAYLRSNY